MKSKRKISPTTQKWWDYLVTKFTPEYIENMADPKEYVVGFGPNNKSFCYLVEYELNDLGGARGATSAKYGLWYGTHGTDNNREYRATKQYFNGDVNKAFSEIKIALAKLIRETQSLTAFKDLQSILFGMFKYKVMYLYNPKIMLPSFVEEDLQHFEECLNLKPSKNFETSQNNLLQYKQANYPDMSNHEFAHYLYETFGRYNIAIANKINDEKDDKLNQQIINYHDPLDNYVTTVREKLSLKKGSDGVYYYPRDYKMALYALANAKHKCENDVSHHCFIRKSNGQPYTEVHHLVPLCFYGRFNVSLDVPENIVSLCSNCHNEIHYGRDADIIIKKLFQQRKDKLKEAGINITEQELLDMYHKINKQK